jgi:N-acetylglucosamine malate deacetylase 1
MKALRARTQPRDDAPAVLAVAAHPDDIEFVMAGTLLLLGRAGWTLHYMNLTTGNCGSTQFSAARTRAVRRREAQRAAAALGATWHAPICDDLEVLYTVPLLRRVASVMRKVAPRIVLTHSPQDYMEDHMNACRLAVTAAFARGMPNFRTDPAHPAVPGEVTVYHAMPHGLTDGLGQAVVPSCFVDTTAVQAAKGSALALHQSQREWLDVSQGMGSYVKAMEDQSRMVGRMSRRFRHAEGWRRHSHLGFCHAQADPLRDALPGKVCPAAEGPIPA